MEDAFRGNSRIRLIDFYGSFPDSELFPSIKENGLLYGFLSKMDKNILSPVLGSFENTGQPSCRFTFGDDISLIYASRGFRRFYSGFEDIYSETLTATSNLPQEELEKRIGRLDVLKRKFESLVKTNPSEVAEDGRVSEIERLLGMQREVYSGLPEDFT